MVDEIAEDVDTLCRKEGVGMDQEDEDRMNRTMLWDDIDPPEDFNLDVFLDMGDGPDCCPQSSSSAALAPPSNFDDSLSIGQIEDFLFNEHDEPDPPHLLAVDDFLSGILLDSPVPSSTTTTACSENNLSSSPDIVSLQQHNCLHDAQPQQEAVKDSSQRQESQQQQSPPFSHDSHPEMEYDHRCHLQEEVVVQVEEEDGDDPITKKRKRQMRNRDAAVRSRERKKMYVRDLEIKSRYYESECRRLGMLLQCCIAENHALRLSLHNGSKAFGASKTKQESAVLLLESLLLGSLLWLLGTIGLPSLPRQLLSILEVAHWENMGDKDLGSLAPREARSDIDGSLELRLIRQSLMMGKRCRGSRRKMRCSVRDVCLLSCH